MKKRLCSLCSVLMLLVVLALPVTATEGYAPEFDVYADAVYLVNTDSNLVVYEKNSEESMSSASVTKLMTTLLLLESYQDQLDTITLTAPSYIYDILYGKNASTADIRRGETQSLRNILYAMLLPSGNEAAYMVADYMGGGSVAGFVEQMNAEAEKLGCTGTVFTDPCGLDAGNITTAKDAYLMLRAAMGYDAFVQAAGATSYDMGTNERYTTPGTYIIQNTNKMLAADSSYYRSYTRGGKTGTLDDWQNFVSWHTQDGETYICAVLHSPQAIDPDNKRPALLETAKLVDWAFATYSITAALDTTQPITELPVAYSTQTDTLMLYPADSMLTLMPKGGAALTQQSYHLPARVLAPIKQGDVVGTVTLSINGEELGTVDLIAGSDVARNQVLYTMEKVGEFFSSTYFKVVVILTMIAIAVYTFLWVCALILHPKRRGGGR
ncbi:MAG: serine hydrolase [Gemmiger sp.]|nr:serine hydrolase [Gemmiger sp.]